MTERRNIEKGEPQEATLRAVVESESSRGRCGGPWRHELTPVVKHCGVTLASNGGGPVLLVNPAWLSELVARDELDVLAAEMRTWFAINSELITSAQGCQGRRPAA